MHNPAVQDALLDCARFWLERGVDGFRLDAINYAMHDLALRDNPPAPDDGTPRTRPYDFQLSLFNKSHPDIPRFIERIRELTDRYEGRFTVAEVGGADSETEMKRFISGSRLFHTAYGFNFLYADRLTPALVERAVAAWPDGAGVGWPSWAFSNHDAPRAVTRWASAADRVAMAARAVACDRMLGQRRDSRRLETAGAHRTRGAEELVIMFIRCIGVALAFFASVAFASANTTVATVASPGNILQVTVTIDDEGRPAYAVTRAGTPVIEDSRLGFLLTDAPKLERNFKSDGTATRSVDETWEQPWGERRYVRNHYHEMKVTLVEKTGAERRFAVVFRVYDDGVGFRYEFPSQPQLQQVNIAEELTEFAVAGPATAWWIPAGEWNRYEYLYNRTSLSEVGQAHTPITIRTDRGLHIAIHEAALVDYSSMWVRRVTGTRLKAELSPSSQGPKVSRAAPFTTPWRTLQIADSAGGLYMSDLILNLNEPNKLGDVSWFKPAKYVGIWWQMHLGTATWASGPQHGATTENAKRYIDFAAKNGFRGVLIEGWNEGWDGDWFANGETFSFTRSYPDFDLEAVASYARRRGVHLIGHHETSGNIAHYEPQLAAGLDLYAKLGIDSVKTGYVADAGGIKAPGEDGQIRYEWHDGQVMSRHHLKVVTEAARRHIAVVSHEPIKDTGLRRTYPNWIAREGARGMEYNAWGTPPNPPEHEANLVFTRMLGGPMDFTPGVLSLLGKGGQPIQSTIAKQLALYVVIYSPLQMAADLPENYEKYPRPFQFIKDVPTDWQDTRVVNGEVGDYVTFARKDRNSDDWYIGSVTDENARTLEVPLDFLDAGRRYRARIYRDADDADWKSNPHAIVIETREVRRGDTLTLKLAPGGGEAIRLQASGRRRR